MRRPWIGFVVFIVLVAVTVSAVWFWGGNGDWGSHHDQVVRVVNADGTAIGPGNTIVIESRRGGPFFPFFLFPLFIFGFFFVMRRAFWGSRRSPWTNHGYGPNGTSQPAAWFDEWHRQAHGGNLSSEPGSPSETTAHAQDPKASVTPDAPERPESR